VAAESDTFELGAQGTGAQAKCARISADGGAHFFPKPPHDPRMRGGGDPVNQATQGFQVR